MKTRSFIGLLVAGNIKIAAQQNALISYVDVLYSLFVAVHLEILLIIP